MSSPSRKWGRGVSPSFYIFLFWCESGELGRRRTSRFPCVTTVVETSSDRVTFRIPLNINDRAPLRKQPMALTRRLFPQKSSTADPRLDSKCGSDWRRCGALLYLFINPLFAVDFFTCKSMEFVAASRCTKKWLRFDHTIRNLTSGDANSFR